MVLLQKYFSLFFSINCTYSLYATFFCHGRDKYLHQKDIKIIYHYFNEQLKCKKYICTLMCCIGSDSEESACNAEDLGSAPEL